MFFAIWGAVASTLDAIQSYRSKEREDFIEQIGMNISFASRHLLVWQTINALGLKPFKDGDQWCFLYGEDIQSGICGFGYTLETAADDFYKNFTDAEVNNLFESHT